MGWGGVDVMVFECMDGGMEGGMDGLDGWMKLIFCVYL